SLSPRSTAANRTTSIRPQPSTTRPQSATTRSTGSTPSAPRLTPADRTCRSSADRDHPPDRDPGPIGNLRRDLDLVHAVAQRVAELRQRDHLHVAAVGGLVGGDEVHL